MSSEVVKMPGAAAAEDVAPAVDVSLIRNFEGDRQIQIRVPMPNQMPVAAADAIMDGALRIMDRVAAKYELPKIRDELQVTKNKLENLTAAQAELREKHAKLLAEKDVEAETLVKASAQIYDKARDAHYKSGRQGSFAPKGNDAVNIKRHDDGVERIKGEIVKAKAEHAQSEQQQAALIADFTQRIVVLEQKIAANEKLIG
jgi:hypothetical protein